MTHTLGKPSIPGFEHVTRYWDRENHSIAAKILPGEYYVTKQNELVTTVLGSCVSACIWDIRLGIGGMNHFMLPETTENRLNTRDEAIVGIASRYGNYAMEHLINTILRHGGQRQDLQVKLFGGAKVIATLGDVGARNIEFVMDYVATENLNLVSYDLGDICPRKVIFFPKTGRVRLKKIKHLTSDTLLIREKQYRSSIKEETMEGSVELF